MKIKEVPIDVPIPYENNPRYPGDSVERVAALLKRFGWQQPIVLDTENVVIVGHQRLAAAKSLGMKKVPVTIADKLTKEEAAAYRIGDNRASEHSSWVWEMLAEERQWIEQFADEELFAITFDPGFNEKLDLMIDGDFGELDEMNDPGSPFEHMTVRVLVEDLNQLDTVSGAIRDLCEAHPEWTAAVAKR